MTRLAAGLVVAGGVLLAVAVSFVDWRAGVATAGVLLMAGGLSSLRSPNG